MEYKELFDMIEHPKRIYEKEYYFDEGLGESLKEHVTSIKERFPDVEVLVRRDREGYPIVKTQFKPKYKYNIESLEKFNADDEATKIKETLNDLLKTVVGGDALH